MPFTFFPQAGLPTLLNNIMLRHPIALSLVAGLATLAALAFASMAATLWLAASIEGDARAINEAGALRMSTYRMLATEQDQRLVDREQLQDSAYWQEDFRQRLTSDGLLSALPESSDHPVNQAFQQVLMAWQQSPLADDRVSTPEDAGQLVDDIDAFVLTLEAHSDSKLALIRVTLWGFATLAALAVIMLGVWLWRQVIRPLNTLTAQASALEKTQLHVRSRLQGRHELAMLSHSLDQMAAELEAVYADMQAQIDERTQTLVQERASSALQEERSVIARELHDSLAQALTYQKMQLALLQAHLEQQLPDDPTWRESMGTLRSNVNEGYRKLRELLSTFRLQLNYTSLDEALAATVREFQPNTRTRLEVQGRFGKLRLPPQHEIHVLHIIREALTNVIKHAAASQASVNIEHSGRQVSVSIADDGVGLAGSKTVEDGYGHLGLRILYERAAQLQGDLTIQSDTDRHGTEVLLRFMAQE